MPSVFTTLQMSRVPWTVGWCLLLSYSLTPNTTNAFIIQRHFGTRLQPVVFATPGDIPDSNDAMRRMLEAYWNSATMGEIPTNPILAAAAAADAILNAQQQQNGELPAPIVCFVDVILPQYDIKRPQYDEVMAVELCIGIANCLEGQSAIYVKNQTALNIVEKCLQVRGETAAATIAESDYDEDDDDDDDDDEQGEGANPPDIEFYDDFADFTGSSVFVTTNEEEKVNNIAPDTERTSISTRKKYRLTSLFGNTTISKGTSMSDDILTALRSNRPSEETLILCSSSSREECIALRSLVVSYQSAKTIILVNCQLDLIPREVSKAETVYYFFPLVMAGPSMKTPKSAVVLRQFPGKWQVHVNEKERGFELAKEADNSAFAPNRGPSMEWIAKHVLLYLDSKFGK